MPCPLKVSWCFEGTSCPCLGLKSKPSKKLAGCCACCLLHADFFSYSSTLKMEVICSFKTLVDFRQNTQHYIIEDRTLHNHFWENLRYFISLYSFCVVVGVNWWTVAAGISNSMELGMPLSWHDLRDCIPNRYYRWNHKEMPWLQYQEKWS
jgi:hypothetical protein